jgi:sugar/nucleoside kinase (ribokinase family)
VLPHVDVFLPSCDELAIMLGVSSNAANDVIDSTKLTAMAGALFEFGVPIVAIKLGDQGLYLRTSEAVANLGSRSAWRDFNSKSWLGRELLAPCFDVPVAGTTGAGDCTIAGFLKAMLQHEDPATAIKHATMVGAFSVQSVDATSNIPPWSSIADRDSNSWPIRRPTIRLANWRYSEQAGVFVGPLDDVARTASD